MMNFNEEHFSWTSAAEVKHITKPLENCGLNFFYHLRYYYDEKTYALLTNNPLWHENFREMKVPGSLPDYSFQQGVYMWEDIYPHEVHLKARNYDIDHPIDFIYPASQYIDIFGFGAPIEQQFTINLYFNNLDYLVQYTKYFQEKSRDLFLQADQYRLMVPQRMLEKHDTQETNSFFLNHHPVCSRFSCKRCKLTSKEWQCIQYESRGMSAKEIAKKMEVNAKTVEIHFRNIGSKTNCFLRSERMKFFQEYYEDTVPYLRRDK